MAVRARRRSGTVLIVVAGLSALLACMGLAFLVRLRSDADEGQVMLRETQAHLMLSAACTYLQEASRLGYDGAGTSDQHLEGYGWIDVRDGCIGPKATSLSSTVDPARAPHTDDSYLQNNDSRFPLLSHRRFPMYVKEIPPFAIRLDAAPNPIDPAVGIPYLSHPDPMPVLAPADATHPTESEFAAFEAGDPRPRPNSTGMAWFRLYRLGSSADPRFSRYNAATFIVTCGAGASLGYRSWPEVTADNQQAVFGGDPVAFSAMVTAETRLWYLVEWSAAVSGEVMFNTIHDRNPTLDANDVSFAISQYNQFPINCSHYTHSQARMVNFGGTIRLVQRLVTEPPEW